MHYARQTGWSGSTAMIGLSAKLLALALIAAIPFAGVRAAPPSCSAATDKGRELAHPAVSGSIGPFRPVVVLLTRSADIDRGAFDVRLRLAGGKCVVLPGPDDPNQVFLYDVKAVMLTPVRRARGNVLVVLFNSSQIGPMHGTERQALVYRLSADRSGNVRSQRRLLDGVATIAGVRRRLKGAR